MVSRMPAHVWSNWTKRSNSPTGYKLAGNGKEDSVQSSAADFEGSLRQDGNKVVLHQKLALKKRVYEAGDWNGFRNAVNAHKSFGDYIVIKR